MSYDLILGDTKRDWAAEEPHSTLPHPQPRARRRLQIRSPHWPRPSSDEIASATNLAIRLSRSKRLPPADHDAYRKFHAAWIVYSDQHARALDTARQPQPVEPPSDQQAVQRQFKVFDTVASTPSRARGPRHRHGAAAPSPGHPVAVLLGTGLAIGALAWLGGQKKWRPV